LKSTQELAPPWEFIDAPQGRRAPCSTAK